MAFLQPEYAKGKFAVGEIAGEAIVVPEKHQKEMIWDDDSNIEEGWFCRLCASGPSIATVWTGPFASKQEAMDFVEEQLCVDSDTGDDLMVEDEEEAA